MQVNQEPYFVICQKMNGFENVQINALEMLYMTGNCQLTHNLCHNATRCSATKLDPQWQDTWSLGKSLCHTPRPCTTHQNSPVPCNQTVYHAARPSAMKLHIEPWPYFMQQDLVSCSMSFYHTTKTAARSAPAAQQHDHLPCSSSNHLPCSSSKSLLPWKISKTHHHEAATIR